MRRVLVPPLDALPSRPAGARLLSIGGATMGTTWSARVAAASDLPRSLFEQAACAELDAVIAEMSTWDPTSALARFNAAPAGSNHFLPPRFAAVMACARAVAAESDGAFDPTLGALVDLWGFGPSPAAHLPPPSAALRAAREVSGLGRLGDAGDHLVQPGGLRLDLSGIAKGFAVDAVAARLAHAGAQAALVEIGGELAGFGVKPDGSPWWVALETLDPDLPPTTIALCGQSVATSGDTRRFHTVDGARLAHTIDPRTGAPASTSVAAVTVVHTSCMCADAYATALAVLGVQEGRALAERLDLAARIVVRGPAGMVEHLSPAMAAMLAD